MALVHDLLQVARVGGIPELRDFRRHIDPAWMEEALQATGTATVRRRRLPAEQVVWLVIGMALMRDRPITDVVAALELCLPSRGRRDVAPSAIVGARSRLGAEPVAYLFERTAQKWAYESAAAHRWRELQLFSLDGTTLRVADSDENREHFGLASGGHRGDSGYPMARIVCLMALRSHLLADVRFGPYKGSELSYAKELWSKIPDQSLTLVDRAYLTPLVLVPLQRGGQERHWLTRTKSNTKWRVLQRLGPKDALVELTTSSHALRQDPSLPPTWTARAIAYSHKGSSSNWILTSLVDPKRYPRKELVALYHERWEIELGYDELKTEMLRSEFALRSRKVEGVKQEMWGIFLAYNLVRLEIENVAKDAGVEPTQISFAGSLRLICDTWLRCSLPDAPMISGDVHRLQSSLRRLFLPPRRPRAYPRAVKIKMSAYAKKRRPPPPARPQPNRVPQPPRVSLIHECGGRPAK